MGRITMTKLALTLAVLLTLVVSCTALKCWVSDAQGGNYQQDCGAKCVKTTTNGVDVKSCGLVSAGCRKAQVDGKDVETCVETCVTELCNGGMASAPSAALVLMTIAAAAVLA